MRARKQRRLQQAKEREDRAREMAKKEGRPDISKLPKYIPWKFYYREMGRRYGWDKDTVNRLTEWQVHMYLASDEAIGEGRIRISAGDALAYRDRKQAEEELGIPLE